MDITLITFLLLIIYINFKYQFKKIILIPIEKIIDKLNKMATNPISILKENEDKLA